MSRQVGRVNQQSKGETPLRSGVLQRAAVRAVADKEGEATEDVESGRLRESRFRHDFSQMPIYRGGLPKEVPKTPNQTGLPDDLKARVENLSGYSLDDARVHYNSPKPAQLQALAYTQGTEIHVAPGQETHLPHEAWHVVQQMQGRVKPTMQMKGVQINEDRALERESDRMANNYSARQKNPIQKNENNTGILQFSRRRKINILENSRLIQENFFKAIRTSVNKKGKGEDHDQMARQDAKGLGVIAGKIEERYPRDEFVYVGVGTSPDIILELLHLRGARTISLPVSGVKNAIPSTEEQEVNAIDYITSQLKDYAYVPINLLLLDATETNATLTTITNLIKKSDSKKGNKRIIKSTSITQTKTEGPEVDETIEDSGIEVLNINDRETRVLMRERFFQQRYKQVIGRSSPNIPFKDIIAGKNPTVEFNEEDLANIMRFTRIVHGSINLENDNLPLDDAMIDAI